MSQRFIAQAPPRDVRWLGVLILLGGTAVGCDDGGGVTPRPDASTDVVSASDVVGTDVVATDDTPVVATDTPPPRDGNATDVVTADVPVGTFDVRVAHLSPGAPAVDFCVRPASATSWSGVSPTLRGLGVTAGLAYTQVTRYLSLPAGAYTVRLVAPNSANCDAALANLPDSTLPMLAAGARATVSAVGVLGDMGATAFRLNPTVEDAPAGMGQLKIRFVHASPGTPGVDLGIPGMGTMFTSLFSNVAFPNAAAMSFTSTTAITNASLAARVAGMETQAGMYPLQIDGVSVPLGATVTAFAVGRLGNTETPLSALVCVDGAASMANANLTNCTVLTNRPEPINVRVAHLSPGAPAVDFCLRPASATSWSGVTPTLRGLGVAAGLAYTQVTRYLSVDPGAYTVRLVAPNSANCDTALAGLPDSNLPMLAPGTRATVSAVGVLGDMGATAFRLNPTVEDAPAGMGQLKIRFVHASPGTPGVDLGIPGMGTMFTSLFSNVAFPNAAAMSFTSTTAINNASLAARVAGMETQAGMYPLQIDGVSVPLGATVTAFAVGRLGNNTTPLSALVCTDGVASMANANLTNCAVLTNRPEPINVRVAHLSPGAPAVDFCLRPASATSWSGVTPTLRGLRVAAGLAYTQVTRYLSVDPGAYTVRLVAPNSANCDTALAGLPDSNLPMLAPGTRATVSAVGVLGDMGATAFRLNPTVEDAPAGTGQLKIRFVHASPGTPGVDLGIPGMGTMFTSLFSNVAFPNAAAMSFTSTTAITNASLAARVAGVATQAGMYPLQIDGVSVPLGATVTAFAVGRLANTQTPLSALVCVDGAASMANANLTNCTVLTNRPEPINVRVAHLSPGAPAVDFCLRPASATSWSGVTPTLRGLGVAAGLAYTQVTRYLSVDAGAYTVRIVAPNSANCDTALAGLPDSNLPMLAAGARATVSAVGVLGDTGATAFRLNPTVEDAPAGTGQLKIRFVHASPGTPAVDLGIPGAGTAFTALFSNVAFPNAGAPNFTSTTAINNVSLAARVAGMATQAGAYPLQIDGVSVPVGATVTAFAVGRLGNNTTPLSALVCTDGVASMANANLTNCAVLTGRPPAINVRVAHLGPDAPAVDFCLRPSTATTWTGVTPTLRGLGVTAGLAYTQVTRYLSIPPGAYTVRLVAPNSANCDASLGGLPDSTLPALADRTFATVAAVGTLFADSNPDNDFRLAPIVDDDSAAPSGQIRLRVVHASPGTPAVDVGIPGAGTAFTGVFNNLAFPNGSAYVNTAPLANASLAARVANTPTAAGAYPLRLDGVTLPAGARATVFAVGILNNDQVPLSALVCTEGATMNAVIPCALLPERVFVRVGHLSPDAPAVDFCLRPSTAPNFNGLAPTLRSLGFTGGFSFPTLTRYLALPPGTYVARIVAPTATNCDTALAGLPDVTLPALPVGARATVAASGLLAGNGASAFGLRAFVDGNVRPELGRANLRFVHLSPGAPNVDVGLVSGSTFTPVFTDTPFGAVGNNPSRDSFGYLSVAPISGSTIQVRVAGTTTAVVSYTPFNLPALVARGLSQTVFAIGTVGGTGNSRLSALFCLDREPAPPGLSAPCVRLPAN